MRLLHILLILVLLLAYASPLIDPNSFWPMATLGLVSPILWFVLLLFAFYWIRKKDNALYLSLVVLVLGWDMLSVVFAWPDGQQATANESLKIVSLNGHAFKTDDKKAALYIKDLAADVVCFQEFYQHKAKTELVKQMQNTAGFKHAYYDYKGGMAVFSHYPLKNGATHYFKNRVNGYLSIDVEAPTGVFRLFNVHLQTNAISSMANKMAEEGDLKEKKTWLTIKGMLSRHGRSSATRVTQSKRILAEVKASPYPVVLCGDFNEVPTSFLYQQYRSLFQDAHLAQSWGLGATYAGSLRGLRIDYLMPDHHFAIHEMQTHDCFFSDHKAISMRFSAL